VTTLILKRASASRLSSEWNEDDYDVLATGVVVGRAYELGRSSLSRMAGPALEQIIFLCCATFFSRSGVPCA
jgi:hypothetical protein